jgi:hypothetical protein
MLATGATYVHSIMKEKDVHTYILPTTPPHDEFKNNSPLLADSIRVLVQQPNYYYGSIILAITASSS